METERKGSHRTGAIEVALIAKSWNSDDGLDSGVTLTCETPGWEVEIREVSRLDTRRYLDMEKNVFLVCAQKGFRLKVGGLRDLKKHESGRWDQTFSFIEPKCPKGYRITCRWT